MLLRYIGEKKDYNVQLRAVNPNVVSATGLDVAQTEGFTVKDDNDVVYDYSAYKTIYRMLDGAVQFSNDGSIWVEPPTPPVPPTPDPDPTPSLEEQVDELMEAICDIDDRVYALESAN